MTVLYRAHGHQTSFELNSVDELIEARACEALIEIRLMVAEARKFVNRSLGQRLRYQHERFESEAVQSRLSRMFDVQPVEKV